MGNKEITSYLRVWLNGRVGPSQGQGCEFDSRHPLQITLLLFSEVASLSVVCHPII